MRKQPIWDTNAEMPGFRALDCDTQADVCVVGGGIAGLSAAYLLTRAGKSVVVLDSGELGRGMTGVTTAHLTCVLDERYADIARIRGETIARIAAQSHQAAINRIDAIIAEEGIDCDFERLPGFLFRAPGDPEEVLPSEFEALRHAGVFEAVMVDRAPIPGFETGPCVAIPSQAQFHPRKYLAGVARALQRAGAEIYANTRADVIEGGDAARVQSGHRTVVADDVVVATNTPINDLVAIHTKQAPYMTYVIAAPIDGGALPRALLWDTLDAYHYVRRHRISGCDYIIVGGEDHKSGQASDTTERHGRLEAWARERFPAMGPIEYVWAGQVMQSLDGLAYIGRNPLDKANVYVATGDSGTGMTHGTIAGILLTDLILGRKNPWEDAYDPSRKPVGAVGTFVKETANMAAQFGDWLKPGEVTTPEEIPSGSGALLRDGLGMIAAYRDPQGRLHEMSAVCNHLGCLVHWNGADSTWDCPCHGSRFDRFGRVINGPANKNLSPVAPGKMRTG